MALTGEAQHIDLGDVCRCPSCGGHNTTTGELCLYCSLAKKCSEDADFKRQLDKRIEQVMEMMPGC